MPNEAKRIVFGALLLMGFAGALLVSRPEESTLASVPRLRFRAVGDATSAVAPASPPEDVAALAAFERAYPVFISPRCQNCHPSGDAPLQGDDSHVHAQDIKRGPDGRGVYGVTCHTCHQDANLPGANMPPGNPKWGLPPPQMKMVFVGRSAGELCRQLKDPKQNGGRSLAQILTHVSTDDLVGWGWNPGDGRTLPPLNRPEFVAAMEEWVKDGAACPP
jgi:mono/diheme cytochrome c family protein